MPAKLLIPPLAVAALLAGCEGGRSDVARLQVPGGDPTRGQALIEAIGCGRCHVIPGIDIADGKVGPPLTNWAQRSYIAGNLPNAPDNLIRWLIDPHAIEPGTVMPNLGLDERQARDIAAYLYTIE